MNARWSASVLAVLLGTSACERPVPGQLQQSYWPVSDFALTERNGQTVTLADLKGKVWVADFFYTACPGPCPMLSSRLRDLQKEVGTDDRVRLVSISTDPERDTPAVLRQYAEQFQANDRWLFLTGSKAAIRDLALTGFKLPFSETPGGPEPIIHATRLILVDQTGVIRGLYDGTDAAAPKQLLRDLRLLLTPKP